MTLIGCEHAVCHSIDRRQYAINVTKTND